MPYSRLKKMDSEKHHRIMETALTEFLDKNFETASINQISKNAGLSSGALYYYFENKEDLFKTTVEYVAVELFIDMGNPTDLFKENGYWETIKLIVLRRLEYTISHQRHMQLFHRIITSNDPIERESKALFTQPFHRIFDYGYENGYIRKDLPKSLVFNIHLTMTIEVTKWLLDQQLSQMDSNYDLMSLSGSTIEMIKSAIGGE